MLTSPSESDISFRGSDSLDSVDDINENLGSNSDDWGIVSNDGSNIGNGVLIMDGVASSTRNDSSDLSIPGTYSLPTEIGSLSDDVMTGFHDNQGYTSYPWAIRKRQLFLFLVPLLGASIAGFGFLYRERNSWRSSTQRLEQEIQRLEREKLQIKSSCDTKPESDIPDEKESNLFTIIDNCWVTAKADVKLGSCGDETQENVRDFATRAWDNWGAFWNNTSSLDTVTMMGAMGAMGAMGHALKQAATTCQSENASSDGSYKSEEERKKGFDHASSFMSSFPLAFGEVIAAASKQFSSKITNLMDSKNETGNATTSDSETVKIGLSQASEALSEAMNAASEAVTFEIKELSEDPVNYLASAVKGASQTAERVTMKGLFDAASAVSSAYKTFGEALADTSGEAISVMMTEIMDDESEVKQD